jgi:hypothetical protein
MHLTDFELETWDMEKDIEEDLERDIGKDVEKDDAE